MRTIKFRGKCAKDSKYAGEWVEGGLLQCEKSKDVLIVYSITDTCSCTYHVDPATVGQFTGLYDKNGKEIYEGDIIKWYEISATANQNGAHQPTGRFSSSSSRKETNNEQGRHKYDD